MKRVVIALLAAVLVSLAAGAVLAASPPDATSACATGTDGAVVAVENGATYTVSESVDVYPGTHLYVAYCEDGTPVQPRVGDASNWGIEDAAGFENVTVEGYWYSVIVPEDESEITLDGDTLAGKNPQNGLTVTVQRGKRLDSTLAAERLPFRPDAYDRFGTAETRYRSALTSVEANLSRLNETTGKIRNGGVEAFRTEHAEAATRALGDLNASVTAMRTQAGIMEEVLYAAATDRTLPAEQYASTLEALAHQQGRTDDRLMKALNDYRNALQSVERTAENSILVKTMAGLLVGALVGATGGGYRVYQYGQKVHDFSDFRGKDFDASLLRGPVGLGLALLLAGLVLFVLAGPGVVLL